MKIRSVLLGLLGVLFVCGGSFFNDRVLRQTYLVGNSMPVSVYALLIMLVVVVNPVLSRLRRGLGFTAAELALALTLTLASCPIPGSGLLRTFTSGLIMPVRYQKTLPAWNKHRIVDSVPERFLPDYKSSDIVEEGFINGLGEGSKHAKVSDVPWAAWARPFAFWLPMIALLWFAMLALGVVLHQQWANHEHIPYPIAGFVDMLLPSGRNGGSTIFRNHMFWVGLAFVLFIHVNNYLQVWFPDKLIPVQLTLPLGGFSKIFPTIRNGGGGGLFWPHIYFIVIGLSFLIPSDVSFTFALAPWLWALVSGFLMKYGISLTAVVEGSNWYTGLKPSMFLLLGSSFGLFLTICYTGRHYYWSVFATALGSRRHPEVTSAQRWGARLFLVFIAAFCCYLCYAGMDWQLAIMYTMVLVTFYVVMSRVVCETGLFHLQLNIFPCVIIWGILGAANLGPTTLLMMQMISLVLICDPRESLMPIMMNSLKLVDKYRQPIGKATALSGLAMVIGLAVALPLTLYIQYDLGGAIHEGWAEDAASRMMFDNAIAVKQKLIAQGTLEASEAVSGWGRFAHIQPEPMSMLCFVVGLVLVLVFCYARLHVTGWPLHPMLFVTWNTPHIQVLAGSFFMGWLVKTIVIKYGGNGVYNKVKPVMIGLIAGEILGAFIPSITAAIYYFITNEQPVWFRILLS